MVLGLTRERRRHNMQKRPRCENSEDSLGEKRRRTYDISDVIEIE